MSSRFGQKKVNSLFQLANGTIVTGQVLNE